MAKCYELIQGERILSAVHNDIQTNGVFFSTPTLSEVGTVSIYTLDDFDLEQTIFEGLKLKLNITQTATKSQIIIRIKNVDYQINDSFIAGNIYNLVYTNNNFIVEKSGGGGSGLTIAEISDFLFPIGSIYTSTNSNFDPNGVFTGTWQLVAPGRVLVGLDSQDPNFMPATATGGSKTNIINTQNLPAHNHSLTTSGVHTHAMETTGVHAHDYSHSHTMVHNHDFNTGYLRTALQRSSNGTQQAAGSNVVEMQLTGFTPLASVGALQQMNMNSYTGSTTSQSNVTTVTSGSHTHSIYNAGDHTHTVGNTGSGTALNNLQPYYVVYFLERKSQ